MEESMRPGVLGGPRGLKGTGRNGMPAPPPGVPGTHGMPPGPPPPGFKLPQADVSHIARKYLDIVYADTSPTQRLDIYLPETGDGPFPIILHLHGGAFEIGGRRDFHILTWLRGLGYGYAVVSVEYRLSGEAIFPAGIQDAKAAVRWLRAHGSEHSLDADRVVAVGGSSGGNYAAMLCAAGGEALFDDAALGNAEYASDIQAAVDMFGPTDFLKMDEHLTANGLTPADHSEVTSPESRYLGARITEIPDRVRLANPITYVHKGMPPILIQHGTADSTVPVQQSVEFARAIEERVGTAAFELDIFEGGVHDDLVFDSDENMARVFEFLDRHLK
jgi:acetyl esterase/lipase